MELDNLYALQARRGNAEKLALPFALITDLVQTDTEISALLEAYDVSHLTASFKVESDKFLEHAHTISG